ncbi:MAG: EAL domain-containing protein [Hyphomicrobiaceae bacterium]
MDQPTKPLPPRRGSADRGARDAFVLIAITLIVAALGLGLHMQFAMSYWLALLVALTAYAALITVHALVRRGQVMADLEAEIRELRQQLEQAQRPSQSATVDREREAAELPRKSDPRGGQPHPGSPSQVLPGSLAQPLQSLQAGRDLGANGPPPLSHPHAPQPPPLAQSPAVSRSSMPAPRPTPPAPSAPSAPPTQRQLIEEALTAIRNSPSPEVPLAMQKPAAPAPRMATSQPPPTPSSSGSGVATWATSPPSGAAQNLPGQAAIKESAIAPYWQLRPGERADPELPMAATDVPRSKVPPPPPAPSAPPDVVRPTASGSSLPSQTSPSGPPPLVTSAVASVSEGPPPPAAPAPLPAIATAPSMAPSVSRQPPGQSQPTEAGDKRPDLVEPVDDQNAPDLESMQHLIQQLATQLNKPADRGPVEIRRAPPIPSRPFVGGETAERASEAAAKSKALTADQPAPEIGASVAALRQMADVMQRPVEMAATPSSTHPTSWAGDAGDTTRDGGAGGAMEPGPSPYARLAVIAEAVAADRVDLFLDPILALEDRKARHFEVSVRLCDDNGATIAADELAPVIGGTGLLARIDAAKLTRTAAVADRLAQRGNNASLFANLQPESLADNGFLDVFADTFVDREPICTRLVLAFTQADVRDFADVHWEAIATMTELGFRFALEHVTDLDMDFELLKENGFAFVKLDASVFLEGMQAGDDLVPSADICRHMAELGLGLVVGGIVDEMDLAKIMGFGVIYGQGALFGEPRAVQVEVKVRDAA